MSDPYQDQTALDLRWLRHHFGWHKQGDDVRMWYDKECSDCVLLQWVDSEKEGELYRLLGGPCTSSIFVRTRGHVRSIAALYGIPLKAELASVSILDDNEADFPAVDDGTGEWANATEGAR